MLKTSQTLQDSTPRLRFRHAMLPSDLTVERFLEHCHRRRYPKRTDVFRPGDPGDTMYFVVKGSLNIVAEEEDGRELILGYVRDGEFIGEAGVFIEAPKRDVVLRTRTNCELAEIGHDRLHQLLQGPLIDIAPQILYAIGMQLTKRLLHASRKVSRLAFKDVRHRVESALVDLCHEPDAIDHPKGTQIKVSRQEISRIVGCSREMAGRVIKELVEEDLIYARGKTMVIYGIKKDEYAHSRV